MAVQQESVRPLKNISQPVDVKRQVTSIGEVIFTYGPPVIKALATAAVLFEVSMGMGKLRQKNIINGNKSGSELPCEPFVRDNPGPHAVINNLARKIEHYSGVNCGRGWRRKKKRKG